MFEVKTEFPCFYSHDTSSGLSSSSRNKKGDLPAAFERVIPASIPSQSYAITIKQNAADRIQQYFAEHSGN